MSTRRLGLAAMRRGLSRDQRASANRSSHPNSTVAVTASAAKPGCDAAMAWWMGGRHHSSLLTTHRSCNRHPLPFQALGMSFWARGYCISKCPLHTLAMHVRVSRPPTAAFRNQPPFAPRHWLLASPVDLVTLVHGHGGHFWLQAPGCSLPSHSADTWTPWTRPRPDVASICMSSRSMSAVLRTL